MIEAAEKPAEAKAEPTVRIISRAHDGFRRGGVAHPADETYPADHFSAEQLAIIEAEPLLTVIYQDGAAPPKANKAKR
jgi:hypothetical protein